MANVFDRPKKDDPSPKGVKMEKTEKVERENQKVEKMEKEIH